MLRLALLALVAGCLGLTAGCAGQPSAGQLTGQEPVAAASDPVPPVVPATQSASPSARAVEQTERTPDVVGQLRANVPVERSNAIEAALRKYLRRAPADLKSFHVVVDDGASATVGAQVGYRGKLVNLSVAVVTDGGQVRVRGAYALRGNS